MIIQARRTTKDLFSLLLSLHLIFRGFREFALKTHNNQKRDRDREIGLQSTSETNKANRQRYAAVCRETQREWQTDRRTDIQRTTTRICNCSGTASNISQCQRVYSDRLLIRVFLIRPPDGPNICSRIKWRALPAICDVMNHCY